MLTKETIDKINSTEISVYGGKLNAGELLNRLVSVPTADEIEEDEEEYTDFIMVLEGIAMDMAQEGTL